MPIDDPDDRGTEKDGSKSELYCKFCYQNGAFVDPEMNLDKMKNIVVTQMHKRNISQAIIQHSLNTISGLKRWSH